MSYRNNLFAAHKIIEDLQEELKETQDELENEKGSSRWERKTVRWKEFHQSLIFAFIMMAGGIFGTLGLIFFLAWAEINLEPKEVETEYKSYTIVVGPVEIHPIEETEVLMEEEVIYSRTPLPEIGPNKTEPIIRIYPGWVRELDGVYNQ